MTHLFAAIALTLDPVRRRQGHALGFLTVMAVVAIAAAAITLTLVALPSLAAWSLLGVLLGGCRLLFR